MSVLWKFVLDHVSEKELYTTFPMIPSFVLFWIFAAVFTLFDLYPSISPILRWKIQPESEKPSKILLMALIALFNQFLLIMLGHFLYDTTKQMAPKYSVEELPSVINTVAQITIFAFMYDFGFYVFHRMMHIPWLYKNIHVVHHSSKIPCVLAQVYFHPIDLLFSVIPVTLPPILLNSHIAVRTLWNCVLMLESMNAHCGYHFPYLPDSRAHDFHHSHPHRYSNFGSFFLVWDQIFGTDIEYKKYLNRVEEKSTVLSKMVENILSQTDHVINNDNNSDGDSSESVDSISNTLISRNDNEILEELMKRNWNDSSSSDGRRPLRRSS